MQIMKCIVDIAKLYVFLINLTATIFLGLVVSFLIYLFFESKTLLGFPIEPDLSPANPSALHFILLLISFTLSAFFCLFAFLGCAGTACHSKCLLGSYLLILTILSMLTMVGLACLYMSYNSEVDYMYHEAKKTILYYEAKESNSIVRWGWDTAQSQLRCCGAENFKDWENTQGIKPGRKVPASCCIGRELISDCVYEPDPANAHMMGCVREFEFELRLVFWAVPFLVFSSFLATMLVYCNMSQKHEHVSNNTHYTTRDYYSRPKEFYAQQQQQQIPSYYDARHTLGYSYAVQPGGRRSGPPPYSH